MATPGTIISSLGHVGLFGWLIIGWGLNSEPFEVASIDVSVISGEEFEQMRAGSTPVPGQADPTAPVPPELTEVPAPLAPEDPPQTPKPPPTVETPAPEDPPPPPPAPETPTEVADVPPPSPEPPAPSPPTPDVAVSETPAPPQAPTVASTITAPPPPEATVDDIVRDKVVADSTATAEVVQEEQEATAPEQTTTEIVIDDLAPSTEVTTSIRPVARPTRPAPQPVSAPEPAPQPETSEDDVAAALEAALSAPTESPALPAGPPMTGSERDSFRIAVNRCWNVDPGSVASRVTVEVGFSLDRDGRVTGNVELLSSDGDQSATNIAFEAARRAILRCQSGGYQLPADKYEHWKDVVITFDPSGMRLR